MDTEFAMLVFKYSKNAQKPQRVHMGAMFGAQHAWSTDVGTL